MKSTIFLMLFGSMIALSTASKIAAHCEMPCGIYDDELRIKLITEETETIEKAMKEITELSKENPINFNQLVRWISTKENHADEIQHIVTQYFMTQRIKPEAKNYTEELSLLHKMLISAMKCKQTTDLEHVESIRTLVKEFEELYFEH
jgi:nickel superoxide dismutase